MDCLILLFLKSLPCFSPIASLHQFAEIAVTLSLVMRYDLTAEECKHTGIISRLGVGWQ